MLNRDFGILKTSYIIHNGINIPIGTYRGGDQRYIFDFSQYQTVIFDCGSPRETDASSREFVVISCPWKAFSEDGYYCVNTAAGMMTMWFSMSEKLIDFYKVPKKVQAIIGLKNRNDQVGA